MPMCSPLWFRLPVML